MDFSWGRFPLEFILFYLDMSSENNLKKIQHNILKIMRSSSSLDSWWLKILLSQMSDLLSQFAVKRTYWPLVHQLKIVLARHSGLQSLYRKLGQVHLNPKCTQCTFVSNSFLLYFKLVLYLLYYCACRLFVAFIVLFATESICWCICPKI